MSRRGRAKGRWRRWTEADARSALAALDASGLSVAGFAARQGMSAERLYRWRHRLADKPQSVMTAPAFIEVQRHVAAVVEVVLRSGRMLRTSESIDGAVLRRFADALEDAAEC